MTFSLLSAHDGGMATPGSSKPLRVNDLLFITEYLSNGRNGTHAYLKIHPHAQPDSARANASEILAKAHIRAEIATRIQHEAGITRAFVESALLKHYHLAEEKGDYLAGASIAMDCAKLAGFLVDKRADVTVPPTLSEPQLTEALRQRGYVSVPVN